MMVVGDEFGGSIAFVGSKIAEGVLVVVFVVHGFRGGAGAVGQVAEVIAGGLHVGHRVVEVVSGSVIGGVL